MNIQQALEGAKSQLNHLGNPKLEAEVLLAAVVKKGRVFFRTHEDCGLSFWQKFKYKKFVQKRKKNIPVAYIVGSKNWMGMQISVNKNVLIPRDETEVLVQKIADEWTDQRDRVPPLPWEARRGSDSFKILDLGTGSGAIAIYLARTFPEARVVGSDISKKALRVARKNAKKLLSPPSSEEGGIPPLVGEARWGMKTNILKSLVCQKRRARINFIHSDFFSHIPAQHFDLIVANLPYVPEKRITNNEQRIMKNVASLRGAESDVAISVGMRLSPDLSYEPHDAIFSGLDGLDHYRQLVTEILEKDITFGQLWVEFLPFQKEGIQEVFQNFQISFYDDVGGEVFFAKIY